MAAKVLLICSILIVVFEDFTTSETIVTQCKKKCQSLAQQVTEETDLRCDAHCQVALCSEGCVLWEQKQNLSCQQVCASNESLQYKEQHCQTGCNLAVDINAHEVLGEIHNLMKPVLISGSRTNTSLKLQWQLRRSLPANVSRLLQLRRRGSGKSWQYHKDVLWLDTGQVIIQNLQPYQKYKFRIVLSVTSEMIVKSPPSSAVRTLPYGAPSSPPRVLSISRLPTSLHIKWRSPTQMNAPLTNYEVLISSPRSSMLPRSKHVPHTRSVTTDTIAWLKSDTLYTVRIAARNKFGIGPAVIRDVKTPPFAETKEGGIPVLVVGAGSKVLQKNVTELFDYMAIPDTTYSTENMSVLVNGTTIVYNGDVSIIEGVNFHFSRRILFVSDTSGSVHRLTVTLRGVSIDTIYNSSANPTFLSVDWLHNKLYILEKTKVCMCNIDDNSCGTVLRTRRGAIENIQVDPYNGYFFWSQRGHRQGLYRIDLVHVQGGKIYIPTPSDILIQSETMGAFTVDFQNYRLFYPNEDMNTMMSVNLDGTEVMNVRNNTSNPVFNAVKNLVYHSGVFYWSNGMNLLKEEFEAGPKLYHHNDVFFYEQDGNVSQVNIWHPSSQPAPVPQAAPTNVQVLFGVDSALMRWDVPRHDAGFGSWHDWLYEISISDDDGTDDRVRNMNKTSCRLYKLRPLRMYAIRVRGYSSSGAGPWSDAFRGQTLQADKSVPHFLVTDGKVLYRSPLDGTDTMAIITNPVPSGLLIDVHFVNNTYFMLTTVGHIYRREGTRVVRYPHITNAEAMDVDWLANRVYWSNSRQGMDSGRICILLEIGGAVQKQVCSTQSVTFWWDSASVLTGIYRCDMNGQLIETVFPSAARDLAVDAVNGYLFWTTMHSVECARLNGEQHMEIRKLPLLSDHYALGVTLDLSAGHAFWIISEFGRASLYRGSLTPFTGSCVDNVTKVGDWKRVSRMPLLHNYGNKLLWLNQNGSLVVSDFRGKNQAIVHFGELALAGQLRSFTVVHHLLHPYPADLNQKNILVVPKAVDVKSIRVVGNASDFYIRWTPTYVNHGHVQYEVRLTHDHHQEVMDVNMPFVRLQGLHPFTFISLALRAYTVWGTAPVVHTNLTSPMTIPSTPTRPRVFTTQHKELLDSEIYVDVEFRWSPPDHPNGIITNYRVRHREDHSPDWIINDRRKNTFFSLGSLRPGNIYHFQVWACSNVGCGNKTAVVTANTSVEEPRPNLLVSTGGIINITDPDIDRSTTLVKGHPTAMANLAYDETAYWVDTSMKVMRMRNNDGVKQLTQTNGTCKSMAIDWLGRTLFWAEDRRNDDNTIVKYDLDNDKSQAEVVIRRLNVIGTVAVDPYHSKLYWIELVQPASGRLMMADIHGNQVTSLIQSPNEGKRNKRQVDCDCPAMSLAPVFVMDHTHGRDAEIYVVENSTGNVWAGDTDGCHCRMVVDANRLKHSGLPPDSMTVDQHRLYWTNKDETLINSVDKVSGHNIETRSIPDPGLVLAIGSHLQPYPDKSCLIPAEYTETPDFVAHTNASITLRLMPVQVAPQCVGISMASVKYTVHYRPVTNDNDNVECTDLNVHCQIMVTYEGMHTVSNLKPYKQYLFQVSVSNFYMETKRMAPKMGPAVIYRTKEGVPNPAQNVTARPILPTEIEIQWWLPKEPNGRPEDLVFKVKWWTSNNDQTSSQGVITEIKRGQKVFYASVGKLFSEQRYWFEVLTYGKSEIGPSVSANVSTLTYQYPGPITLMSSSCESLQVAWTSPTDNSISRHTIQYTEVSVKKWFHAHQMPMHTHNGTEYTVTVGSLKPNTDYAFRVAVIYKPQNFFGWPRDLLYVFRTSAGKPEIPIAPVVRQRVGGVYEVYWRKPHDFGARIITYCLEMRSESIANWTIIYNGSDVTWTVSKLEPGELYIFRVAAQNQIGWSNFSGNSTPFFLPKLPKELKSDREDLTAVLAISFTVVIIMIVTVIIVMCVVFKRRRAEKDLQLEFINGLRNHRQDVELATLRELPHISIQQNNTLYAVNIVPTDEDVAALPHFSRDQLQLTKFLGSGAFGEVFEGLANNIISDDSGDTKVAVKTLHKGATDQEKEEFLKEALLMSHFKHDHILRLLGVCLDNDPQFIILELMEGGDLLSYLRSSRHTPMNPPVITLQDMTSICIDVAQGCVYLEEMHFVHRDIAARNCLVSSTDPASRIVKMGDFGLARDIYKNDYYRKEGEGLLPVRWMSPESLIDGVFTTQSDVWAFGVLMWEVLTLGQQPYPARTNVEVLHYVRSGGRLDRPDNCPDDLYHLMIKCWSYSADERPSFSYILEQLERFQKRIGLTPSTEETADSRNEGDGGIDNLAFDAVENPKGMSTVNLESMKVLGGSMRLTPTSKKRRLQNLLGLAEDNDSMVLENPNIQSSDAPVLPGTVKRAVSFDMNALKSPSKHPKQEEPQCTSYLEPQNSGKRPTYLELLNDPSPFPGLEENRGQRVHLTNGNRSQPYQSNTQMPLNYAQLASNDEEDDDDLNEESTGADKLFGMPSSSSSSLPSAKPLNYAAIATSENQYDSDTDTSNEINLNNKKMRKSGSGIHYAQLAPVDTNPDMDTDNEALGQNYGLEAESKGTGGTSKSGGGAKKKSSLKPKSHKSMSDHDHPTGKKTSRSSSGSRVPGSSPLLGESRNSSSDQKSPTALSNSNPCSSRKKKSPLKSTHNDSSSHSPPSRNSCSENSLLSNGLYTKPSTAESPC